MNKEKEFQKFIRKSWLRGISIKEVHFDDPELDSLVNYKDESGRYIDCNFGRVKVS